jgi:hypothetical protein
MALMYSPQGEAEKAMDVKTMLLSQTEYSGSSQSIEMALSKGMSITCRHPAIERGRRAKWFHWWDHS